MNIRSLVARVAFVTSMAASIGLAAPACAGAVGHGGHGGHGVHSVRASTLAELASAIETANSTGRATVIRVAPGIYDASLQYVSSYGPSSLPAVSADISIEGAGSDNTTLRGGSYFQRMFTVVPGGRLAISGLTVTGNVALCPPSECETKAGGAVANIEGTLWIDHCVFSANSAGTTEGSTAALGGAILSTRGHLHLEDSTVENNASMNGGGVAIIGGSAIVLRSIVRGNSLKGGRSNYGTVAGGGLLARDAAVWIVGSTFSANSAYEPIDEYLGLGGGMFTSGGMLWMKDSSVVENRAGPVGSGAGIYNGGRMTIVNSTVGSNAAGTLGGGLFNAGSLEVRSSTVARNSVAGGHFFGAGNVVYPPGCRVGPSPQQQLCISLGGGLWNEATATARIANTVIAENTKPGALSADCGGMVVSNGRNALGADADCVLQPANGSTPPDLKNLAVGLGALLENGEPGFAHFPLLAGSPLIDAGGAVWDRCTLFDQIDHVRTDGNSDGRIRCDIGAIEFTRSGRR